MGKLKLREATTNEDYFFIKNLYCSEPGIREIFNGKDTRIIKSYHVFIIEVDGEDIGFINTVDEELRNFGFLDIGIKGDYRGKKYGEIATMEVVKFYLENFPNTRFYIIGETKNYNTAANKSASSIGKFLMSKDDINYYLINNHMYEDLIETGNIDLLTEHIFKEKEKTFYRPNKK